MVFNYKSFIRYTLKILSLGYFVLLFYIVFGARRRRTGVLYDGLVNYMPFKDKILFMKQYALWNSREIEEFCQDLLGNVFLFIPLIFTVYWLFEKKMSNIQMICIIIGLSLFIELTQFVSKIGVADIDDFILNFIGGIMGMFIFKFFYKKFKCVS